MRVYDKSRPVLLHGQPADRRSVGIDLSDTVKAKIDNIPIVQLELGATIAKKYPA